MAKSATAAYMKALMNWRFICREDKVMAQLTSGVPSQQISSQNVYQDESGYIVYLEAVYA